MHITKILVTQEVLWRQSSQIKIRLVERRYRHAKTYTIEVKRRHGWVNLAVVAYSTLAAFIQLEKSDYTATVYEILDLARDELGFSFSKRGKCLQSSALHFKRSDIETPQSTFLETVIGERICQSGICHEAILKALTSLIGYIDNFPNYLDTLSKEPAYSN